jgi:tetratricopeptide (TPR) repeat protein
LVSCCEIQFGDSAEAHNSRGVCYVDSGNFEQAISEWNRALEIDPQYADAYNYDEFDQGIVDLDKAITINPNQADSYWMRGMCLADIGETQRAIADLEKALELGLLPVEQEYVRELLDELSQ